MASPVQGLPTGGGSSPERYFAFAGGRDKNYSAHYLAGTGYVNMIRNGSFESWSQATAMAAGTRPDAWETNATGLFGRNDTRQWGQYGCKIQKKSTDGAVSRIYQTIKAFPTAAMMYQDRGKVFSWSVWCKTTRGAGTMVPYAYDGTNYIYGQPYAGSDDWEELTQAICFDSTATDFKVGVEVAEEASAAYQDYHIDCAMLVWGRANTQWSENPLDRGVICQDWDEDGTDVSLRGAVRIIPFEVSDTASGGARLELIHSYVLTYGCRQIMHVGLNLYSTNATREYYEVFATNYSTTGFDIYLRRSDTRNIAAVDWVVTGVIYAIGWDAPSEQFK